MRLLHFVLAFMPVLALAEPAPVRPTSPLGLTLKVVPEHPIPGERVFWRAQLPNVSSKAVSIPVDAFRWMQFSALFLPPNSVQGLSTSTRHHLTSPPSWRRFGPGEVIETAGELGQEVKECRSGCRAGSVLLHIQGDSFSASIAQGLAADQVMLTDLSATSTLIIESPPASVFPVLERSAADAVKLRVLGVRAVQKGIRVRVRLENLMDCASMKHT